MIIAKAILKINSNAKFAIFGEDINTCEIEWHNGTIPISKEDIQAQLPIVEAEMEQAEQDAINKKASGKQKLLDLGLTEEEVKALIGI